MKKLLGISIIAAAACIALTGCASGCASCGKNSVSSTASLKSNWYEVPGYDGMQPPFLESAGSSEKATYSVTYDKSGAGNSNYSLAYENGVYTTEFTGKTMSLSLVHESYREAFERAQTKDEKVRGLVLYYYKTTFTIDVTFDFGGDKSDTFTDTIETETYFRTTGQGMRPVWSRETVDVHSPAEQQPSSLENTYRHVKRETVTSYNLQNSRAVVQTVIDDGEPAERSYGVSSSAFDTNTIYLVARAMALSGGSSQGITLFYPMSGTSASYSVTGGSTKLEDAELTQILAVPAIDAAIPQPEEGDKSINYISSRINLSSGSLTGTDQTVWFAKVPSAGKNELRAAMLKINTVLPFGLGSLNYVLTDITFANC